VDENGLEHLSIRIGPQKVLAAGTIIGASGGGFSCNYAFELDGDWRTRGFTIEVLQKLGHRSLTLRRNGARWSVDDRERPEFDRCFDLDLSSSPFTNTIAIRQLRLQPRAQRDFRSLFVELPDLTLAPSVQQYERLDEDEPPRRYRYRDLGRRSGFTSDIDVDADGLAVRYAGLFERVLG
jgi:hypothetical protein